MKKPTTIAMCMSAVCAVPALAGGLANLNPVDSLCIDLRGVNAVNSQGACVAEDSGCQSGPEPDGVFQCTDNNLNPLDGGICVDQACYEVGDQLIADVELGPTLSPACAAQLFVGWDPDELVFLGYTIDPEGETDSGGGPWMVLIESVDPLAGELDVALALPGAVGCNASTGILGGATLLRVVFQAQTTVCKGAGVTFRDVVPPSGIGGPTGSLTLTGCNGDLLPSGSDHLTVRAPAEWACPASSSGHADCPGDTRTVLFPPIAVTTCDPDPPANEDLCTLSYYPACFDDDDCAVSCVNNVCSTPEVPKGIDLAALLDGGGAFPPGRTSVSCSYVDSCGVASACSFNIDNDGRHIPLYVDADAPGLDNGSDWGNAYNDLQDALSNPGVINGSVCEIWVASGIYAPAPPGGDRSASFHMRSGLAVYGGFLGTESVLEERPLAFNQTILTGDLNQDDGVVGNSDNSRHVVSANFTDSLARLDGFTIIAGHADLPPLGHLGGGLQCINGDVTVANCAFFGNRAQFGAGIYNENGSPTIVNCLFAANVAAPPVGQGGALLSTGASEPTLLNCSFSLNFAGSGGAVYNQAGVMLATNNILWGNSDGTGGGQMAQITVAGGEVILDYSCIQGGWSGSGGTGIIDQNPLFVNATSANLRLQAGSPCIDAGFDDVVTLDSDIEGSVRIFGTAVDCGAFEFLPDCNDNGVADGVDIAEGSSLDCNLNEVPDECDIADGTSEDCDLGGVPDECQVLADTDGDGAVDICDPDDDNDGVADRLDPGPLNPAVCGDLDADLCDDCSAGVDGFGPLPDADPLNDGLDTDSDGLCNAGDSDDDNDGVVDGFDPARQDPMVCGDADGDGCDDCSIGTDGFGPLTDSNVLNDGPDTDGDGSCDSGDSDDDNDGVADEFDPAGEDPSVCGDADGDQCDDCSVGTDGFGPLSDRDTANDGTDTDSDGACDAGDGDDDADGVADQFDPSPLDPSVCGDLDDDQCDDCVVGTDGLGPRPDGDTFNDGIDTDGDGLCDVGDPDDDNDGVADEIDPAVTDPTVCGDIDLDSCDDCAGGGDGFGPLTDADPGDDGLDSDGDGLCDLGDDDDDNDGVSDRDDPQATDSSVCGDTDEDGCDDCAVGTDGPGPLPDADPANDGTDTDSDGVCDSGDADDDNDGVPDDIDPAPLVPTVCGDVDGDQCDDCSVGVDGLGPQPDADTDNDGLDTDSDGACDAGDGDDDNDGVADENDPAQVDPAVCGDSDADDCDDCSIGLDGFGELADSDPANDGPDTDGDGQCDAGDHDDDNDGVIDALDPQPIDPSVCGDIDGDSCDDCVIGTDGLGPLPDGMPTADGPDLDEDGLCDAGDDDDDNDGVADEFDPMPEDPSVCGDLDGDDCDDCALGVDGFGPLPDQDVDNDGPDFDVDGLCDAGDGDDDNDGVADMFDPAPFDPAVCGDVDDDLCDDCVIGTDGVGPLRDSNPGNDGLDTDGDGLCDAGDEDDDNDGVSDSFDPAPFDPTVCGDLDADECDDCTFGHDGFGPLSDVDAANDGLDTDGDGLCDAGDVDDDNDGVADARDISPTDPFSCGDTDEDQCDDCAVGTDGFGPRPDADVLADGSDNDNDGICDAGDPDDDNDGVADEADPDRLDPSVCGDTDIDQCDDCTIGVDGLGPLPDGSPGNDGLDTDEDGQCNVGDPDDDNDGVVDTSDPFRHDPFLCGDLDEDECDDCTIGVDGLGPLPDGDVTNDGQDTDGDGACDVGDPCPLDNPDDPDGDGICGDGKGCSGILDDDNDGIPNNCDNCISVANPEQEDCDDDGIGDACAFASGSLDCNGNGLPDECDLPPFGDSLDCNRNGVPSECEADCCTVLADCADLNVDGVRDDGCVWWACVHEVCEPTAVIFADMGGPFADCRPDGAADGNDRFHALNCFADIDPPDTPGYLCEDNAPVAFNVDTGGRFGSCAPDGVCDGNDVFAALNVFGNMTTCACSGDGGPAPLVMPRTVGTVDLVLAADREWLEPHGIITVDVYLEGPVEQLRGYQLHMQSGGGALGELTLIDISIHQGSVEPVVGRHDRNDTRSALEHVFAEWPFWDAYNTVTGQMVAGLASSGVDIGRGYLATFSFQASAEARGTFTIELLSDDADSAQRTYLFVTEPTDRIMIARVRPVLVTVE